MFDKNEKYPHIKIKVKALLSIKIYIYMSFIFFLRFVSLFLTVLGLSCSLWDFSSGGVRGSSLAAVHKLSIWPMAQGTLVSQ